MRSPTTSYVGTSWLVDPDRLATILARQTPAWPPGARQAYHALTLGDVGSPGRLQMLFGLLFRFACEAMNPRSNIHRALVVNPGTAVYHDPERVYTRDLEVPSGKAVGTARAIA